MFLYGEAASYLVPYAVCPVCSTRTWPWCVFAFSLSRCFSSALLGSSSPILWQWARCNEPRLFAAHISAFSVVGMEGNTVVGAVNWRNSDYVRVHFDVCAWSVYETERTFVLTSSCMREVENLFVSRYSLEIVSLLFRCCALLVHLQRILHRHFLVLSCNFSAYLHHYPDVEQLVSSSISIWILVFKKTKPAYRMTNVSRYSLVFVAVVGTNIWMTSLMIALLTHLFSQSSKVNIINAKDAKKQ